MRVQSFVQRRSLRLLFANTTIVVLAILMLSSTYPEKAGTVTNAAVSQQLVTEYVALTDNGAQWKDIGEADAQRGSWERGGKNPKTHINWPDYRLVKMPGNEYQISVSLHKTKEELLEIVRRWQNYNPDEHFEILTLEHSAEANVWAEATDKELKYYIYSGNVAKSERK